MPQPLPPHVQWLVANRGPGLHAVLVDQGVEPDVERALAVLVDADPSPGLNAVQWLCTTLLGGGMRWEDVAAGAASKAGETLRWFSQYRAALPRGQRNLENHASLGSVYQAIQPQLQASQLELAAVDELEAGGRALRRQQRLQAYGDSIVLCQRPDLIVAVPLTRDASCWWGRGTRWCTAADTSNMFANYHDEAPLIVVVMPAIASGPGEQNIGKLQLHIDAHGRAQFMDSSDQDVSTDFVHQHWDILGPLVSWAAARSTKMLAHVPPEHCTREMCMQAVGIDGWALAHVPDNLVDEQLCLAAMGSTGQALRRVPQKFRTPPVCMAAVANHGFSLAHVPHEHRTGELYMAAVQSRAAVLCMVPEDMRTYQLCMLAMQGGATLDYVPSALRGRELVEMAIGVRGLNLSSVAHADQDRRLCMMAVDQQGMALEFVRPDLLDAEMVTRAVASNGHALRHVPPHLANPEVYRLAVEAAGFELMHVPPEHRTRELCIRAVANNGRAILSVPRPLIDEDMLLVAVRQQPWIIGSDYQGRLSPAVVRAAITQDAGLCLDIDDLDLDLVVECVPLNGMLLKHVPQRLITPGLCLQALLENGYAIDYVPAHLRGEVLAAQAALPTKDARVMPACSWKAEVALAGLAEALAAPPDRPVEDNGLDYGPVSG